MMYRDQKIVVVMPAYNASTTLFMTYQEVLDQGIVDVIILVDDASHDDTVTIAREFPDVKVFVHDKNMGYGANQKTCYRMALAESADIVIMVHPDYQYTPKLIPAMASLLGSGLYHCVLGSRVLGGQALKSGMPIWKYLANRLLTLIENLVLGAKISEYHTGYRAFSRTLLEEIPYERNSNGFVFDNQILAQILWFGYPIGEISCPARYFAEASSIGFLKSIQYGFGCLWTALTFRLAKLNLIHSPRFSSRNERFQKTPSKVTH
jgi:glycosyltransferase involved in cell wall biosynthesis